MLPVDFVYWSASAAKTFDSLQSARALGRSGAAAGERPVELVVRGMLSPRARQELAARRIQVRERFLTSR